MQGKRDSSPRDETKEQLQKARTKRERGEAQPQCQLKLEEKRTERAAETAKRISQTQNRDAPKAIHPSQKGKKRASMAERCLVLRAIEEKRS